MNFEEHMIQIRIKLEETIRGYIEDNFDSSTKEEYDLYDEIVDKIEQDGI